MRDGYNIIKRFRFAKNNKHEKIDVWDFAEIEVFVKQCFCQVQLRCRKRRRERLRGKRPFRRKVRVLRCFFNGTESAIFRSGNIRFRRHLFERNYTTTYYTQSSIHTFQSSFQGKYW